MDKVLISFTLSIIFVWLICSEKIQEIIEFRVAVGDSLFGYLRGIDFLLVVLHGELEVCIVSSPHMSRQWT